MADKKIIKARELELSGSTVESVNLGIRKFHDKVYKQISLDDQHVAMEDEAPLPDFDDFGNPDGEAGGDESQVRIERIYGNEGDLAGLTITCRCGEVIELEFTREDDMALPEVESAGDGTDEPEPAGEQPTPEMEQPSALEQTPLDTQSPDEEQNLVDNGEENAEIEET